jgi:ribonuclease HI
VGMILLTLYVWTDGSCDHHDDRRPGGWAFIIQYAGNEFIGSDGCLRTTNNQMELNAILEALWKIEGLNISEKERIVFHTDSNWSIQCLTKAWNCISRDKKTGKIGGHVQWLYDIWSKTSHRLVEFKKVSGHSNDVMNNRVDKMSFAKMQWAKENLR